MENYSLDFASAEIKLKDDVVIVAIEHHQNKMFDRFFNALYEMIYVNTPKDVVEYMLENNEEALFENDFTKNKKATKLEIIFFALLQQVLFEKKINFTTIDPKEKPIFLVKKDYELK